MSDVSSLVKLKPALPKNDITNGLAGWAPEPVIAAPALTAPVPRPAPDAIVFGPYYKPEGKRGYDLIVRCSDRECAVEWARSAGLQCWCCGKTAAVL
jgi:hypothetical protein